MRYRNRRALLAGLACLLAGAAAAADAPHRFGDIELGARYDALARALDMRDIETALAQARKAARPDLGLRGYGCMRREDSYAELSCVSHQEAIAGELVREFRLQFLDGRLQQFSITAELRRRDALVAAIGEAYGAPVEAVVANAPPRLEWRNGVSSITVHSGKDLVFASFELNTYRDAVEHRRASAAQPRNECR